MMSTMPIIRSKAIVPFSPSRRRNFWAMKSTIPERNQAVTMAPA